MIESQDVSNLLTLLDAARAMEEAIGDMFEAEYYDRRSRCRVAECEDEIEPGEVVVRCKASLARRPRACV